MKVGMMAIVSLAAVQVAQRELGIMANVKL